MKQFNIKRFGRLLRWYLCENQRNLTAWTVGLTVVFFLAHSFFSWIFSLGEVRQSGLPVEATTGATGICFIIIFIAIFYSAASIFATLKTKQRRIAYLTLPATVLEHYLVAAVWAIILWPLCIVLAFTVGDLLRASLFLLMGHGWDLGIHPGKIADSYTPLYDVSVAWVVSVFAVAGTWLRRHGFAAGALAAVVISLFLNETSKFLGIPSHGATPSAWTWLWTAFYLAFTIFNYWLSYRLYKRFQIITSKYTNV